MWAIWKWSRSWRTPIWRLMMIWRTRRRWIMWRHRIMWRRGKIRVKLMIWWHLL